MSFSGKSAKSDPKIVIETWKKLPKYWATSLRRCVIGCWMGITPGGATPASFMSYGVAKRMSRDGAKFGTGQLEGVAAPETAAHAAGTSALLPMIALGIPGSPTAAVLLGGLLIWGLQPGPLLFVEQKDFVWGLIASMYLGNIAGLIIVLTCAAVCRDPARAILHHRAGHHRDLCDRRLYRAQRDARHLVHAAVRRGRLRVQEAFLSAGTARSGAGAGRPGGERIPAVDVDLAGRYARLLLQLAGWEHHGPGACHAVLAAGEIAGPLRAKGSSSHCLLLGARNPVVCRCRSCRYIFPPFQTAQVSGERLR